MPNQQSEFKSLFRFALSAGAVEYIECFSDWLVLWEMTGHADAVLWAAALRICSKQHVPFLSSSNLIFSPNFFIELVKFPFWRILQLPSYIAMTIYNILFADLRSIVVLVTYTQYLTCILTKMLDNKCFHLVFLTSLINIVNFNFF